MHAYRISVQQSQCSALVMQSEANHAVLTTIPLGVSTMFITADYSTRIPRARSGGGDSNIPCTCGRDRDQNFDRPKYDLDRLTAVDFRL